MNAFMVLKASYASNHGEITNLTEDAEFDENHPQDLIQRSQQALLSPIARMEQEISWLPELSATQINDIRCLLDTGRSNELLEAIAFLPDLPKANVLAHLCGTVSVDEAFLHGILRSWDDIDQQSLLQFLNSQRQIAGFPQVDGSQLATSIKALESAHARSAALAVWRFDEPGKLMERLVEAEIKKAQSSNILPTFLREKAQAQNILAKFIREYDNLSETRLAQISDAINQQIELARKPISELEAVISEIAELLRQWDDINQPVQVFEQHQGHEEGRSKKIYEKLRSLCLELANERGEFHHAKRLSAALLHTFPELESVAEVLRGDVKALENLDEQQKQFAVVEPLVAACESAKSDVPELKSALQNKGFTQTCTGILNEIHNAFEAAIKVPATGDAAFLVVRDLALFVNNDRNDPETAFRLIDGLITYRHAEPSRDLNSKLDEERSLLHRNWKMAELKRQQGNTSATLKIIYEMLVYAKGSDREELLQLGSRINQKSLAELMAGEGSDRAEALQQPVKSAIGQEKNTPLRRLATFFIGIVLLIAKWSTFFIVIVLLIAIFGG